MALPLDFRQVFSVVTVLLHSILQVGDEPSGNIWLQGYPYDVVNRISVGTHVTIVTQHDDRPSIAHEND
ncbi:MAG TPA: hypothetical protein VGR06_38520 [Actinophytocola sp.]|nr:hypothetical protein [Actinophytocola sp.]